MDKNEDYDLVLLLGGTGSRMKDKPHDNKHLSKLGDKSVLERLKEKIDVYESTVNPFANKYVVTNGKGVEEIMRILGQDYIYFYQEKPTGIPDAAFLPNPKNPFMLQLGDQVYKEPISKFIEGFAKSDEYMRVWLKETEDTNHTVALLDGDWNLKRFVEKPNYGHGIKGYVATGMYMLRPDLKKYISTLPRHTKGENDMSDLGTLVNNELRVGYKMLKGPWYDVNSKEYLERAKQGEYK